MEETSDGLFKKIFLERLQAIFADSVSELIDSNARLRKLIAAQADAVPEKQKEEALQALGDFGTPGDTEKLLQQLETEIDFFMDRISKKLSAGDGRVHNAFWLLGSEALSAVREELEGMGHEEFSESIQRYVFVFDDISRLTDLSVQKLMREIDTQELAKALKIARKEVREKFFCNMSKRATYMLQKDMDFMGTVSRRDAGEAQEKILSIIQRLFDAGEILIALPEDLADGNQEDFTELL